MLDMYSSSKSYRDRRYKIFYYVYLLYTSRTFKALRGEKADKVDNMKMKKGIVFGLVALLVVNIFGMAVGFSSDVGMEDEHISTSFAGGSGTPDDPYQIEDLEGLDDMRVNKSAHYELISDIDASETKDWDGGEGFEPLGYDDFPFEGSLDGQGFDIVNLYINRSSTDSVGLFGYTDGSFITNVEMVDANITGGNNVGGLVGENGEYSTVSNSYATGTVNGTNRVGALVGYNYEGTVENSYATGNVSGNEIVGGLVGWNSGGRVSNSYATGNVSGESKVGGLVGWNRPTYSGWGTVSNSYATGNVSGESKVGGLVGYNSEGTVENSYGTGTVSGNEIIGGLVGYNYEGTVENSYGTGTVSGNEIIGGLVGYNYEGNYEGTVLNCYATGRVNGTSSVGGLIGSGDDSTASFWDTETSGIENGRSGKTTEEMMDIDTFRAVDWDIVAVNDTDDWNTDHTWNIVDTETYPFLSWGGIKPSVNITTPVDTSYVNRTEDEVTWEYEFGAFLITHFEIRLDGDDWIDVGMDTQFTFEQLDEGEHTVEIRVHDNKNNSFTDSVTFVVDVTPPEIDIESPQEEEEIFSTEVTVKWNGSDESGIDFYEIKLNDEDWINVGTDTSHNFSELGEGLHEVIVRGHDNAGNENNDTVTFTISSPPEIEIISPDEGGVFYTDTITIDWNSQEGTHPIDHHEIKLNDGDWIDVGMDTQFTFEQLDEGEHTVEVRVHDNKNNIFTDSVTFVVDVTPPGFEIEITSPVDGEVIEDDVISIIYAVSNPTDETITEDIVLRIRGVEVVVQEGLTLTPGEEWAGEYHWEPGDTGEFTISVEGEDDMDSITITVEEGDDEARYAEVEITSHSEGDEIEKGDEVTIEYSVTNRGISEYAVVIDMVIRDDKSAVYEENKSEVLSPEETYEGEFTWDTSDHDLGNYTVEVATSDGTDVVTINLADEVDDEDEGIGVFLIGGIILLIFIFAIIMLIKKKKGSEVTDEESDKTPPTQQDEKSVSEKMTQNDIDEEDHVENSGEEDHGDVSAIERLKELKESRDEGLISEDKFEEKMDEILKQN